MLSTVFTVIALVISLACVLFCNASLQWIKKDNVESKALAKIAQLELELANLTDILDGMSDTLRKLRSRVTMRDRRSRQKEDAMPDPNEDPAAWKRAMRLKLHNGEIKPHG